MRSATMTRAAGMAFALAMATEFWTAPLPWDVLPAVTALDAPAGETVFKPAPVCDDPQEERAVCQ